MAAMITTV